MFEISLLVIIMVFLLIIGVPIGFTLFFVGLIGVGFLLPHSQFMSGPNIAFHSTNTWMLIAVPLFVLMGEFLIRSGITSKSYDSVQAWVGQLRGGLANANVVLCAIIAAVTGSSVACAAVVGNASIPEMKKLGYAPSLSCGSVAAGGTLGILIPPSIPLIIYSTYAKESVGTLFLAGILPGVILCVFFLIAINIWARAYPNISPIITISFNIKTALQKAIGIFPIVILIVFVLGGIYGGIVTPTEAAAVGCSATLVIGLLKRTLGLRQIIDALLSTVRVTSMIFLIFVGANLLNYVFAYLGTIELFTKWVMRSGLPNLGILIGIYVIYIILGCFFDPISMMIITLPFFIPIVEGIGYDLVWFGIVLVILIEMGLLTPPVGMNLFVIQGIALGVPIQTIVRGTVPFLGVQFVTLSLLTIFPNIVLWPLTLL